MSWFEEEGAHPYDLAPAHAIYKQAANVRLDGPLAYLVAMFVQDISAETGRSVREVMLSILDDLEDGILGLDEDPDEPCPISDYKAPYPHETELREGRMSSFMQAFRRQIELAALNRKFYS